MKNSSCFRNVLSIICAVWVVCGKQVELCMEKETVFPLFAAISEKYSGTAVVSLVAPFTEDCGLFRDRTKRSYPVRRGFRCSNRRKY